MSQFGLVSKDILISTRPSIRALYQSRHKTTHFGYQDVSEEEKSEKVREVFASVAAKYDLMNDLMSGGIHRLWKDYFVKQVAPVPQAKLLDVAGGTGNHSLQQQLWNQIEPVDPQETETAWYGHLSSCLGIEEHQLGLPQCNNILFQKTFALMIEDAGFRRVRYEDLTFGITAIHSGYKL
ncbi:2-methoxy-6-polyprenyl-1,4-benzoquinol methylase, mitochondrial-like [Hyalella azteca]|uniref:2-methoxy-6-polyprenyl-1,4-benzoquinol methylase, mitochondrial-like n=1 Tax=Hyalella azteca TaxID=294128 RepID=A0A979FIC9_HYAAZ|nr:2-methoxy-6-polyprenyl-1,4-benzoquinol methylase, mitochondrial-like [Hyalella azteca]